MFTIPAILILLGYTLFSVMPLRYFDTVIALLAVILGFIPGKFIFSDNGGVRPFLFSRAFSPTRLFLVRWLFGLAILLFAAAMITAILALGIRQAVQTALFQNAFYPSIRYYELHVLWTFGIAALLTYHTTLFWTLRNRYLIKLKLSAVQRWGRRVATLLVVLTFIVFGLALLYLTGIDLFMQVGYITFFLPILQIVFLPAVILQTVLVPFYGVHCYRYQEIES
jgi:hypothetical protein